MQPGPSKAAWRRGARYFRQLYQHKTKMHKRNALSWLVLSLMGLLAVPVSGESPLPQVYGIPVQNLVTARQLVARNDPSVKPAYAQLIEKANSALLSKPRSVMDKTKVAASGNKHDFFSFGPYWWPDPQKPDGLPYFRRDGYVNPQSKIGTDSNNFTSMCGNVEALALAYYFTGQDGYAEKAAELVRVWFLDPKTAMNPSVNYGQAIPGVTDGRFEGVIEMRHLTRITDALALIDTSGAWTPQDHATFKQWLESYYEWLTHSKLSIDQTSTENNHVTWRDVQIAQFSLVLGRKDEARKLLHQDLQYLVEMQIEPTGDQAHELVRTNSLGYSLFNLEALFRLATLGEYAGVDWWSYTTKDHRSLYSALDFLAPYTDPKKPWPKDEVRPAERWRLLPLLVQAYTHNKDPRYRALLDRFGGSGPDFWRLFWPPPKDQPGEPTAHPPAGSN